MGRMGGARLSPRLRCFLVGIDRVDEGNKELSVVSRSQLKSVSERLRRCASMDDIGACWLEGSGVFLAITSEAASTSSDSSLLFVDRIAVAGRDGDEVEIIALSSGRTMVDRGEFLE